MGSFFFNLLGENIVGEAEDKSVEKDNFYTLEEGKKFKNFMIYLIITVIILYGLSFLLTFKKTADKFTDTKNIQVKLLADMDDEDEKPIDTNQENPTGTSFDEKQLELITNADAPKKNMNLKQC